LVDSIKHQTKVQILTMKMAFGMTGADLECTEYRDRHSFAQDGSGKPTAGV
jgi:hypothetical protein